MILIIVNKLFHYRRPLFNALCDFDEVIVIHSGDLVKTSKDRYKEISIPHQRIGPFYFQGQLLRLIKELSPTTVIAIFDLRWVMSFIAMYKFDQTLNWIWWGLDKGKSNIALLIKMLIARRMNPIIFYHDNVKDYFSRKINARSNFLVANNSFYVPNRIKSYLNDKKIRFLNVGSLDARKQNDVTIRAYGNVYRHFDRDIKLTIIGNGPERDYLRALVTALKLDGQVEIINEITDPLLLAEYYSEAIASVSFGQAGLAVLQSMGYGVPFITKNNAISGGEKFNIINGFNGFLCNDCQRDLERILIQLAGNTGLAQKMGENAYFYYSSEASLENMVSNFQKAIYVRASKQ